MASDVQSVTNPASSLVHGSQALTTTSVIPNSGKNLPQDGKTAAPAAGLQSAAAAQQIPAKQQAQTNQQSQTTEQRQASQKAAAAQQAQAEAQAKPQQASQNTLPGQVALLNKYLNDSGRPAQFRASSDKRNIEEINPSTGEVVAQYSATEFAALARSVGISGAVVNSHA